MIGDIRQLAAEAAGAGRGLGAFNVVVLEHAEAFVRAAEEAQLPVVLQISQNAVKHHGALAPLGLSVLELARAATVPVVPFLDHAEDIRLCKEAVELGFPAIMYDGSKLEDAENRATTAEITAWCHERGVAVEAELGEVGARTASTPPTRAPIRGTRRSSWRTREWTCWPWPWAPRTR